MSLQPYRDTPTDGLQAEWARLLLTSFADAGVRRVVVSPGSRSTPFVLAALAEPRLERVDIVDERAASFHALGQAKRTGWPTLLIRTSGTAGANDLPAVIEAGASFAPLVILTADRPVELAASDANQTIDQIKLFGDHVRQFFDLGAADAAPRALRAVRRVAAQAVLRSRWPEPGAVHLNARARKPLEPPTDRETSEIRRRVDDILATPIVTTQLPSRTPDGSLLDDLIDACRRSERGIVVCGPLPIGSSQLGPALRRWVDHMGMVWLAEPSSQLGWHESVVAGWQAILENAAWRQELEPDLIVQLGAPPTTAAWERYLDAHSHVESWVLGPYGWNDPTNTARHRAIADLEPTLAGLAERSASETSETATPETNDWRDRWDRHAQRALRTLQLERDAMGEPLHEATVATTLIEALPDGALLSLGNSLPIRTVGLWAATRESHDPPLTVLHQRGTSGIDGQTAHAAGAASRHDGPAALLIGDLGFLHDLGGLATATSLERPFVIVVVDNRGGRIFEHLPLATHPAVAGGFEPWTTPHDYELGAAAKLYGLPHHRVTERRELAESIDAALRRRGATVIQAVVPPSGAVEDTKRLRRALAE
ncbi:MAG: 2-succinyl-5-enolpyruvyl-6-hydroxy-3-cyclohexene-1-carboxylic-acid synthase [Acidobacteriota bacterium]